MFRSGCGSPWCWVLCILGAIAWWLFASGLLLCAWNSVVASIANVKRARFWQAMVIVLTLAVLFGPLFCGRHALRCHRGDKGCRGENMHGRNQCGSCESWTMPCDSMGHPGK
jgi:hypothetical protein